MKLTVGLLVDILKTLPADTPIWEYSEFHKKDIELPDEKKLKHTESPIQIYEENGYVRVLMPMPQHIHYPKNSDSLFNDGSVWERAVKARHKG